MKKDSRKRPIRKGRPAKSITPGVLERIEELWLEGHSVRQIAAEVKIAKSWVHELIRDRIQPGFAQRRADRLETELARLDTVERHAWAAWRRSQTDDRDGTQSFLQTVAKTIEQRCDLLGYKHAQPLEIDVRVAGRELPDIDAELDELVRQEVAKALKDGHPLAPLQ